MKLATLLIVLTIGIIFPGSTIGQTTAFNFQGRLNDGTSPANGRYDLQFKLFDSITGGNQIGSTLDRSNLLLTNGVFSTTLDFGSAPFASGSRFLEIGVRPFNSPNAHIVLGARQQILSVPLAVRATTAGNADTASNAINATNATNASNATTATTSQNSLSLGGVAANSYARLDVTNAGNLVANNLGSSGLLQLQGNTLQPTTSHGFVKAMVAITADGSIARCYNGATGSSTVPCGFSVENPAEGHYRINFPFQITERFWIVTNDHSTGTGVHSASVTPWTSSNILWVRRFLDNSLTNLPFHLFVY